MQVIVKCDDATGETDSAVGASDSHKTHTTTFNTIYFTTVNP